MQLVEEMKGASIIVETNASIKPGENALLVTDWRTSYVAERVAAAANERGAEVTMTHMSPREYDGNEPPASVASAMLEADVILLVLHTSITHSEATKAALENGARVLSLHISSEEQLITGGLYADFEAMRGKCKQMAERFTEADEARITTSKGTNVVFDLSDRQGNSHSGIVDEPGMFSATINIEANISPVEGTSEGTVVFDGAVPNLGIGVLEDDIVMEIEEGAVVDIDGGREAEKIARVWEEQDTPAVYNIAQLAVGMNPECREFNGWAQNDHGVYGSSHIGIGTSVNLGGVTRAPVHFDAMMSSPKLEFDGEVVLEDREFTIFD